MRKEIAKKLNDGVLKYIELEETGDGLGVNCTKCKNYKEIMSTYSTKSFEEFLTDLILWAVSHECKE